MDFEKLEKVILSCTTKAQLNSAYKYFTLWQKKHELEINSSVATVYHHYNSSAIGMLSGMLKFVK